MNEQYNGKLTANARRLRREMTKEERHLWYDCLKKLPVTVHRQKVLENFIVDFYIASCKIVIEVDGSQHYEPKTQDYDKKRTCFLEEQGLKVLRYTNSDIALHFRQVCEAIDQEVKNRYSGDF